VGKVAADFVIGFVTLAHCCLGQLTILNLAMTAMFVG